MAKPWWQKSGPHQSDQGTPYSLFEKVADTYTFFWETVAHFNPLALILTCSNQTRLPKNEYKG